jgi:hypothetical protein
MPRLFLSYDLEDGNLQVAEGWRLRPDLAGMYYVSS